MVEIPDRLECLFSASVEQQGDSYTIEIPQDELDQGILSRGDTYRVAILPSTPENGATDTRRQDDATSPASATTAGSRASDSQTPPVSEGDMREVTIETIGDQGDGIAKINRGYVVIVPGARPDDELTVEITKVRENVAFAQIHNDENTSTDPAGLDESLEGDMLGPEE